MALRNCWHVCTEGLKDRLIFIDREDFIYGMNSIPLCSHKAPVAVLAFCLMDNHVHFVVNGEESSVKAFINAYIHRLAKRLHWKYDEKEPLKGTRKTIKNVGDEVYLREVIAYVHRNPMAAGICVPTNYEWSTAGVMFRQKAEEKDYVSVDNLGTVAKRKMLSYNGNDFPKGLFLNEDGMILPKSYVLCGFVEKLYKTPTSYMYALNTNKDAELELDFAARGRMAYSDSSLRRKMMTLCKEEYGSEDFESLDFDEKCSVASSLKRYYAASVKQVSRITGIDLDFLHALFGKK